MSSLSQITRVRTSLDMRSSDITSCCTVSMPHSWRIPERLSTTASSKLTSVTATLRWATLSGMQFSPFSPPPSQEQIGRTRQSLMSLHQEVSLRTLTVCVLAASAAILA